MIEIIINEIIVNQAPKFLEKMGDSELMFRMSRNINVKSDLAYLFKIFSYKMDLLLVIIHKMKFYIEKYGLRIIEVHISD